ncbi:MAG: hypothetical protein AMXMBFR34_44670 [Myxococcaceae bacterium]
MPGRARGVRPGAGLGARLSEARAVLRASVEAGAPRGTGTGGERVGARGRSPREEKAPDDPRAEAALLRPPERGDSRRAALPGALAEPPALLPAAEPDDAPRTGPALLPPAAVAVRTTVEPSDAPRTLPALLPPADLDDAPLTAAALRPPPAPGAEPRAEGAPGEDFSRRAERSRSPGVLVDVGRARLRVSREAASAVSEPLRGPPRRDFVIGPPFRPPSPWR